MELSPHGREQESSSEAIAAFEGIALFGSAMVRVLKHALLSYMQLLFISNTRDLLV
jgi:hypothetical protein